MTDSSIIDLDAERVKRLNGSEKAHGKQVDAEFVPHFAIDLNRHPRAVALLYVEGQKIIWEFILPDHAWRGLSFSEALNSVHAKLGEYIERCNR